MMTTQAPSQPSWAPPPSRGWQNACSVIHAVPIQFSDGCQCGLDIERVKACFDEEYVGTATKQRLCLYAV